MTDAATETPAAAAPRGETPLGRILGWVWNGYMRRHRGLIAVALVLMALQGAMMGVLARLIEPMFDRVFVAGDRGALTWVSLAVAATFVVRAFASFGHRSIMHRVGLDVVAAMQRDMTRHLLTLDSAFFTANPVGTLIERVRGDTTLANEIWTKVLSVGAREMVSLVVLIGVALSIDVVWTALALAGIPLLLGPVTLVQRYVRRKTRAAREAAGGLSMRLDEIFHGIDTIKLNTSETREAGRFDGAVGTFRRLEMKSRIGQAAIPSLTDFVAAIGFFLVLYYGGSEIIRGEKTVGEFMSFFTAIGLLFEPLRQVTNVAGAWQAARASLERIHGVMEERPTIRTPAAPRARPADPAAADLAFEDVVVRYGGEAALAGASFTAEAGRTTALVGASGAGKSTTFNVLTRLVDPASGRVTVGGVPTTEMSLDDLRALFSVVTQEAPMFDESLRDNIVMSTPGVDTARIARAIEAANLGDFVAGLPRGLETPAGPRGSSLSGGQRQRVAIARALVRDAPILLLDEATSALDAESEARVQEALDRLARGRTTLVIAHRLSTIRNADKIVVMERGRVVDEGRHDELLARGGAYAALYRLQFEDD